MYNPRPKIFSGKSQVVNRRAKFRRHAYNPFLDDTFNPFHSISDFSAGVIKKYDESEFKDDRRLKAAIKLARC